MDGGDASSADYDTLCEYSDYYSYGCGEAYVPADERPAPGSYEADSPESFTTFVYWSQLSMAGRL